MKMKSGDPQHANVPSLSAHEMAALMLLSYAPIEVESETPDMTALRDAGLAEVIGQDTAKARFSITWDGEVVLRSLRASAVETDVLRR
ncbi:hypothetical protein [Paraburkholderia pallida]|uniref:Uncharacterized protein n=1 Tax=Paraburkholderia pallida TaxID=2547399 RepID=A0A4V1B0Y2_9BURK|nr:hypothetical protein [Paraburkholderia pallida]QBR04363.1 hypothetical protein E1956_45555 [Paraburkholderia pallida]